MGDATSAMHRKGKLAVISELTWAVASAKSGGSAVEYLTARPGKKEEEDVLRTIRCLSPDGSIWPLSDRQRVCPWSGG